MSDPITYLFVPADRPERYAKALASGADRVIIDLEDAVLEDNKAAGRDAVRQADLDWSRIVIRINGTESSHFGADCALLRDIDAPTVMIPKAESGAMLTMVTDAVGTHKSLLPQIETVRGLFAMPDILANAHVTRLVFGHLDFALDLGSGTDHEAMLHARSQIVLHSRLAEKPAPLDSVTPEFRDESVVRRDADAARNLGFGGKLLIHPAQVTPVRAAFTPSDEQIAWARQVLTAIETGARGAVAFNGKMIDKPVEEEARRILGRRIPGRSGQSR